MPPSSIQSFLALGSIKRTSSFIDLRVTEVCLEFVAYIIRKSNVLFPVQFYFTGWGNPSLPEDFPDLRDFLVNFNENESIPVWVIELVEILLKYCDQAEKDPGVYREY